MNQCEQPLCDDDDGDDGDDDDDDDDDDMQPALCTTYSALQQGVPGWSVKYLSCSPP